MSLKMRNAYYIKLGRGGKWEEDSIKRGRLRTPRVPHEIERNKSILRNPQSTAEDRSIAQSRLRDAQALRGRQ